MFGNIRNKRIRSYGRKPVLFFQFPMGVDRRRGRCAVSACFLCDQNAPFEFDGGKSGMTQLVWCPVRYLLVGGQFFVCPLHRPLNRRFVRILVVPTSYLVARRLPYFLHGNSGGKTQTRRLFGLSGTA